MLTSILINVLGFMFFLFIFWKRLKEDYSSQQIFTSAFYILLGFLILYLLALKLSPQYWYWLGFLGVILGAVVAVLRFHLKVYELMEAGINGFLIWLALVFLNDSVANSSLISFLGFAILISLTGLLYFLDSHYRNFTWYRSGRIGFSGLSVAGIFFLVRAIFASVYPHVLTFSGHTEVYLSAVASFIFFLLTYNLSRTKL